MPNSSNAEYHVIAQPEAGRQDKDVNQAMSWDHLRLVAQFGEEMIFMASRYPQKAAWKPI